MCVIERGVVGGSPSWAALLWAENGGGLTFPYMVRLKSIMWRRCFELQS